MPYVKQKDRTEARKHPKTAGELNFAITELMITYVRDHGLSYQTINDISGASTEALAEFRRRVTVAYENTKIFENGDVYPKEGFHG